MKTTRIEIGPKNLVASIDVDAQYSFTPLCPNELPVPNGHEIVDELNAQATFAKLRIGSKDAHSPHAIWAASPLHPALSPLEGEHVDLCWPMHCVPGTKGFELIQGLPHPAHYDFFIYKGIELDMHPYGACFHDLQERLSTGLIEFLHYHQIQTVIVGGLATEYCVFTTVMQLHRAGFKLIVNLGACRGLSPPMIENALHEMTTRGIILVKSTQELVQVKINEKEENFYA